MSTRNIYNRSDYRAEICQGDGSHADVVCIAYDLDEHARQHAVDFFQVKRGDFPLVAPPSGPIPEFRAQLRADGLASAMMAPRDDEAFITAKLTEAYGRDAEISIRRIDL